MVVLMCRNAQAGMKVPHRLCSSADDEYTTKGHGDRCSRGELCCGHRCLCGAGSFEDKHGVFTVLGEEGFALLGGEGNKSSRAKWAGQYGGEIDLVVRFEVEDLGSGHVTPSLVGRSADSVWVVAGLNTSITSQFKSSLPTLRKQCLVPSPLAMRWPARTL